LIKILSDYKHQFDSEKTPQNIFKSFINHYPHFYQGDSKALEEVVLRIKNLNFN
jgi:hypothetical protein